MEQISHSSQHRETGVHTPLTKQAISGAAGPIPQFDRFSETYRRALECAFEALYPDTPYPVTLFVTLSTTLSRTRIRVWSRESHAGTSFPLKYGPSDMSGEERQ
jgi:hypothetical protein